MARPILKGPRKFEIDGEVHNLSRWCELYGISKKTVDGRLRRGMAIREALETPAGTEASERQRRQKVRMVCARCRYSEKVDGYPVCMYIALNPEHKRRPVPAADCAAGKPGSVFEPDTAESRREKLRAVKLKGGRHD